MKYRDILLDFIRTEKIDEMTLWIKEHPDWEQLDILSELKMVWIEEAVRNETENDDAFKQFMTDFDVWLEGYQEKILDVQLASLQYEMATDELDKVAAALEEKINRLREYVIHCILTNADNANEMIEFAKELTALEKESGVYNEDDWSAISYLL